MSNVVDMSFFTTLFPQPIFDTGKCGKEMGKKQASGAAVLSPSLNCA
ncbi:hypothetical protein [Ferrimonas gelatinilytica]